ncbi:beta-lactamase-like protein [Scenedesmus sp. NREL 46B-D3]|nr:beta-lactamase-like protein [Scenedesmus sp. NREL 46B-D3]
MAKRRASQELVDVAGDVSSVRITPLGAGQEVGRSCIIMEYMGKRVMFDCGIHPGLQGENSLPYLTNEDLDELDVALITHFHLDHCAAVPYLLCHTTFKGRIFMTHPTKAIFYTLVSDFANLSGEDALYSKKDVEACMDRIEVVDFDQTILVDGMQITPYRAGHVLGAAMFMVEVAGMRCLYTGDYSRVTDRHLSAADMPPVTPHIVIVESTYGTQLHGPRETRERLFTESIARTVRSGGRVLLPIVAIGRAQELLLLLDEYWARHPQLQGIPIYQASGVARKALNVFATYVAMMNQDIQKAIQFHRNPFHFKHVQVLKGGAAIDDCGPCVVMATPSMLQSGLSRDLFEAWCENSHNTVIIADFAVQGTLARDILASPTHVMSRQGVKLPLRAKVEAISFSAHADFDQTRQFLEELAPPHVVLVHGEFNEMMRLRTALEREATQKGWDRALHTPKTDSSIYIPFTQQHTAAVRGRLADEPAKAGQALRGVLVQQGAIDQILHPEDMSTFTKLTVGKVMHRQAVAVSKPFSEVRLALEVMFEGIEGSGCLPVKSVQPQAAAGSSSGGGHPPEDEQAVCIGDIVMVRHRPGSPALGYESHVVLEWAGGSKGDVVADAVLAVLLQAAGEPSGAAKAEAARQAALAAGDVAGALRAEMQLAGVLLAAQFGPVEVLEAAGQIQLQVDGAEVVVDHVHGKVTCASEPLRVRVEKVLQRITEALRPCALDFED